MTLVKASLQAIKPPGPRLEVQFNPQSLNVTYQGSTSNGASQQQGDKGGAGNGDGSLNTRPIQVTGWSASLSLELLFDTSDSGDDVRSYTNQIANMMRVSGATSAPIIKFQWGTFDFYGVLKTMSEALDYFSDDGKPLRATVNLSMDYQSLEEKENKVALGISAFAGVGTTPLTLASSGDTIQGLTQSVEADWKNVARANGIDNPRQLSGGTVLNLNASAEAPSSASIQASIKSDFSIDF